MFDVAACEMENQAQGEKLKERSLIRMTQERDGGEERGSNRSSGKVCREFWFANRCNTEAIDEEVGS